MFQTVQYSITSRRTRTLSMCPPDWTVIGTSCYKVNPVRSRYDHAKQTCEQTDGARLAFPWSNAEFEALCAWDQLNNLT